MKHLLLLLLAAALLTSSLYAEQRIRVVTYNLNAYPGNDAATRDTCFQHIFDGIKPDIIAANELADSVGADQFRDNVLGDGWEVSPWINEVDFEFALFYKSAMFEVLNGKTYLAAQGSPIVLWEVRYKLDAEAPHLYIATCHLVGQQTGAAARLEQVTLLVDDLKANNLGDYFMFAGDLDVYNSDEAAYQYLLADSVFYDPINRPGTWNNNGDFADIHTQSTRGGGAGGLDDRFDQIVISQPFAHHDAKTWGFFNREGDYVAYGNDGQHFNLDINALPENTYGQDVADNLWVASDHLPVYADFFLGYPDVVSDAAASPKSYNLMTAYPNPFNGSVQLNFSVPAVKDATLAIYNVAGRQVDRLLEGSITAGHHTINWNAGSQPDGIYFARLSYAGNTEIVKLVYVK